MTVYKLATATGPVMRQILEPHYANEEPPQVVLARFEKFTYVLGRLYETEIKAVSERSCFDDADAQRLTEEYGEWTVAIQHGQLSSYGPGFHSSLTVERLTMESSREHNVVIVECTIPAGAKLYTEPTGLVVSDRIIVNKIHSKLEY